MCPINDNIFVLKKQFLFNLNAITGEHIYIYIIFYYYYFIFLKKRFKSLTAQVKMKGERAEKDPESTWQINHARKLSSTHGL